MAETRIQAERDYMQGMKYKDIAEKYGVSLNTVKSWKQRHGWVRNKGAPETKSVHTKKRDAPKQEPIILSDDLTDKQRLFCIYYLKYFNATKAYQKAYGCAYSTAMVEGHRHLRNPKINAEIDRLKAEQANELKLDVQDVIQKYIDIAFADITDFVEFGFKEVTTKEVVGVDKDGAPIINENTDGFNFVDIKESTEVDGTLITEVKQGKDGVSIKLNDRMKALNALEKYVGFMSEEQKARMELIKSKIPNKDQTNINAQITSLADLINNPAPDRVIDDD